MSLYQAHIKYERDLLSETGQQYSRDHRWHFDGGAVVEASASPHIVPVPFSSPQNVDPEEAFVAAVSSCHMLTFLHVAQTAGFTVSTYQDAATGKMEEIDNKQMAITQIKLSPCITYHGKTPSSEIESEFHDKAHHMCFIAKSCAQIAEPCP